MSEVTGRCVIAGEQVEGSRRGEVRNPACVDEVVGTYPLLGTADVDRAVLAAERAQATWRRVPVEERIALVRQSADRIAALGGLGELLTREQGKVSWESTIEIGYYELLADMYGPLVAELDRGEVVIDDDLGRVVRYRDPVGVVLAVTPWNYPFGLAAVKVVPALLAGNAVIIKPSPVTPLTQLEAFGAVADLFPPGLLSVLTGPDDEVSGPLLAHPRVRKIALTGSTPTGRLAAAAAAPTLKNLTLELGGNDAAVLLDDVVLDEELFASLVNGAFTTTGQVCFDIKRVYAPRALVDVVAEGIAAELDRCVIGNGLDPETTMGPLTTRRQRDIVRDLVVDAERHGAKVHTRGELRGDPERGWFLRPSVVTGTPEDHPLVQTEQFGPALPIQPYDDVDEAIRLVNATEQGLTSSVWSADPDHAQKVARWIEAGVTFINSHGLFSMEPAASFGGVKQSGMGRELGIDGLLAFTESHVITTRHP
jgi:aldehyde dehydrogenase